MLFRSQGVQRTEEGDSCIVEEGRGSLRRKRGRGRQPHEEQKGRKVSNGPSNVAVRYLLAEERFTEAALRNAGVGKTKRGRSFDRG